MRFRIDVLAQSDAGQAVWRDALAGNIPSRKVAEKVLAVLRKRHPGDEYRLVEDPHFSFISSLPCLACAIGPPCQVAHVRMSSHAYGKYNTMARKPDEFVIPLCWKCHAAQHHVAEVVYWERLGIDPLDYAKRLREASGDVTVAFALLVKAWAEIRKYRRA